MNVQDVIVTFDDKKLFARIWTPQNESDKTPIILFHDSLGSVELWRGFPEALSRATQRKVIAYDRIGYGKSSANPHPQPLDFISAEAEVYFPHVLEQLNIEKFIGFGHSVGGGMAVHCAAKFPDKCEALITEAAQSYVEERTRAGIREAQIAFADASTFARLKKYHGEKAPWVLDAWTDTWLSEAFDTWTLKEVLPGVQCPLLAIHGSDDEYGSVGQPQLICDYAGGQSTLKIMADCKHVPHREREQEVIDLVVAFLGD